MSSFGNMLAECRNAKNLSQKELAEIFSTSHTTLRKCECDGRTPWFEAAYKLAKILNTTVGYLLGQFNKAALFKAPKMLQQFQDVSNHLDNEKNSLLLTIDNYFKAAKFKLM